MIVPVRWSNAIRALPSGSLSVSSGQRLILGLRPEHLHVGARGSIACLVYSSLPRGMETILRLRLVSLDLHAVVFGSPDFAMGAKVRMKLSGNDFLLFDEASTERISKGSLRTL